MSHSWFEDPLLDTCVQRAVGKYDGPLTADDLACVTSLDIPAQGLRSLAGIEALVGLRDLRLNLVHDYVRDFSPLSALVGLEALSFGTPIGIGYPGAPEQRALSAVSHLPNLLSLCLFDCDVTDLTPLRGLSRLRFLDLRRTKVSSLEPLAALTALETLLIGETAVRILYGVEELPALRTLEAAELNLGGGELKRLSDLQHLRHLDLSDNPLRDVTALRSLVRLEKLTVRHVKLKEVAALAPLRGLRWLDLSGNVVSDLGPLSGLSQLRYLDARRNPVTDWDPVAHVPRVDGRPAPPPAPPPP